MGGALAGQGQFLSVVAEVVRLGAGLAGIYLTAALVVNLAQAHLGAVAGRPQVAAEVLERLIPAVISFAVAASAAGLGQEIARMLSAGAPSEAAGALDLWRALAEFVVRIVIYAVGASLAAGIALGAFSAQLAALAGQPGALATGWARLGLVILTAVLTLAGVRLAEAVLEAAR